MILTLNRHGTAFVQRKPWEGGTPGRYPFPVGFEEIVPTIDDFVFAPPGDQGKVNTLLAQAGLRRGRLMGGHDYTVIAGKGG